MAAAVDVSFGGKFEYRWAIPVRNGQTMLIPCLTQTQARMFLETLQLEYARKAVLYQRAAGQWIKAPTTTETPVRTGTGKMAAGTSGKKTGVKTAGRKKTKAYA